MKQKLLIFSRPAVIKNNRYFGAGYVFLEAAGLDNDDIVYVSLPICKIN